MSRPTATLATPNASIAMDIHDIVLMALACNAFATAARRIKGS